MALRELPCAIRRPRTDRRRRCRLLDRARDSSGEFGAVTLQVLEGLRGIRPNLPSRRRSSTGIRSAGRRSRTRAAPSRTGEMQWHAIVGQPTYQPNDDSKWPGQAPSVGEMDIPVLDALCEVLAAHTTDPDQLLFRALHHQQLGGRLQQGRAPRPPTAQASVGPGPHRPCRTTLGCQSDPRRTRERQRRNA